MNDERPPNWLTALLGRRPEAPPAAPVTLPGVRVMPNPARYGEGRVYRRQPDGPLLYDSPAVTRDGKRPTHRLATIAPRLAPGQTIDDLEREIIAGRGEPPRTSNSLDTLEAEVQGPVSRLIAEARAAGVQLRVGETRRPQERQDALFRQGRNGRGSPVTHTLTSNHAPGRAADLVAPNAAGYQWIQDNARRHGLNVLGMWDGGHVELPARRVAAPGEREFRRWYGEWAQKAGLDPDPDNPLHKYDYRAAYRAGAQPEIDPGDGLYHWPSEYKSDDHPNRFVGGVDTKRSSGRPLRAPGTLSKKMAAALAQGHGGVQPRSLEDILSQYDP